MAKDVSLRLFASNAVLAIVCGLSLPPTTPVRPTTTESGKCVVAGEVHEPGESWNPDPCTYCNCDDNGQHYCAIADCIAPQCHDYVYEEGNCCATCPNGENCLSGNTVIPKGETVRLEDGGECWCEQTGGWGELEAICIPPPPPPICEYNGITHQPGESWNPDPCTYCFCEDNGQHYCAIADCFAPQCHDYVYEEGNCCATCPNGENCLNGNTVIPKGETVTLEDGGECWCEQTGGWRGELEAVCSPSPPTSPSPNCEYDGSIYQSGDEFQPDPCTYCTCDSSGSGEVFCAIMDCAAPQCVEQVFEPGQCCGSCPNGPDCLIGDTVYPEGVLVTLESGERCECAGFGMVVCMPTERCEYNGQEYEAGESFKPDPCTWCQCENGEAQCAMASCAAPPCVDEVYDPTQCCPYCPNGPNCKAGNTVIPLGETVTLDSGETCTCQGEEYGEIVCMPSERCEYDGQEYEAGESFQPNPCTWCQCENGEAQCAMASCPAPPCVDVVYDPTQCCPYCPNGPNCKAGDTVIPLGETVTLDSGETCTCQGEEWALETMCIYPPPPPPTPSVVPDTTTLPPPPPPTTTVSSKTAQRQAKQEERQAKQEERQAKQEERQAKKEARQARKAERQARKAERQVKRAARQAKESN